MANPPVLDRFKNHAIGTLAAGIDASQNFLDLAGSDGSNFPDFVSSSVPYKIEVYNATDFPGVTSDPNREYMRVGGRSSNRLQPLTRGVEGSAAVAHNTGGKTYKAVLVFTAGDLAVIEGKLAGLNPSAFRANLSTNQVVPSGTTTKLRFAAQLIDKAAEFEPWSAGSPTTTGRFTAARDGLYRFRVQIYLTSTTATTLLSLLLQLNGSVDLAYGRRTCPTGTGEITVEAECLRELSAGDFVDAFFTHTQGSNLTVSSNTAGTYFEGHSLYTGT